MALFYKYVFEHPKDEEYILYAVSEKEARKRLLKKTGIKEGHLIRRERW